MPGGHDTPGLRGGRVGSGHRKGYRLFLGYWAAVARDVLLLIPGEQIVGDADQVGIKMPAQDVAQQCAQVLADLVDELIGGYHETVAAVASGALDELLAA